MLPARPAEQLLIDATGGLAARRILCTSLGRAQFAAAWAQRCPDSQVCCHFLDLYQARSARSDSQDVPGQLEIVCQADFPEGEVDLVGLPCSAHGDAELTRDLLQSGYDRLALGGRMAVTTDNPNDAWLHQEMGKLFAKVTRSPGTAGVAYLAVKREPLAKRKEKNFTSEFAFRDGAELIRAVSRPGVFSHRRLDLGARALLESIAVHAGDRILELGCGAGVVSLAAAKRAPNVHVTAVDANARAIECTQRGVELNGVSNLIPRLDADADAGSTDPFDLAVANPPYYSQFRISELFLRGAERALRAGGVVQIVTKQPEAYESLMPRGFQDITATAVRNYWIVRAVRK